MELHEDVELERSLFVLTLQGLLATGDGTRGNPYIVCHPTDEYDVVATLGHEPAGQSLVEYNGRRRLRAVEQLEECFEVSQRQACRVVGQARSTQRYEAQVRSDEPALVQRMHELVRSAPRYGYRRIWAMLRDPFGVA